MTARELGKACLLARCGLGAALLLIGCLAAPVAGAELEVRRITPGGDDVPPARQIVIEFDRPVVPLGRMARRADEVPIEIEPALQCEWRWLNTRALACQLGEDAALVPSTAYTLRIAAALEARDGSRLANAITHRFTTERVDVERTEFHRWRGPGTPAIRVVFNQPVAAQSVAAHLFMRPVGQKSARLAVTLSPVPKEQVGNANGRAATPSASVTEEPVEAGGPARVWLVSPVGELPLDKTIVLVLEPGITSALGELPSTAAREVTRFDTFPPFSFLGVRCLSLERDDWVVWAPDGEGKAGDACDPLGPVNLLFSAPVLNEEVKAHVTLVPDLAAGREDYDPWANRPGYSRLGQPHYKGAEYAVWLPERLKAFQSVSLSVAPGVLADEFGRTLDSVQMQFDTAHRRPQLRLVHRAAVLERDVQTDVPLYVTNLERVGIAYRSLTPERESGGFHSIDVPYAEDFAFALPLEVRDMLGGRSGALSGELQTDPATSRGEPQPFFAQVTPFHVHAKLGHFRSIAWVTDLATGEPVAGAEVTLYRDRYQRLSIEGRARRGPFTTDADGLVTLPGREVLDPALEHTQQWAREEPRLFLAVEKGADMALLPLDADFRMWASGVSSRARRRHGHIRTWGTTAQGVYRAGDTLQYKIFVRNQDSERLVQAPPSTYALRIIDPQGKSLHEEEGIALSAFGTYAGDVPIPENAAVGWYQFEVEASFSEHTWRPMRVLVSDFTPAPFKVAVDLNRAAYAPGDRLVATTLATLHAGGAYANAATRLIARLRARTFSSAHPQAKGFSFDSYDEDRPSSLALHQTNDVLNDNGELDIGFDLDDTAIRYGRIEVESAVRDDRGKSVAGSASAEYSGRDRFVGLRATRWLYQQDEPATVEYLVVDGAGSPVADVDVAMRVEREEVSAARVKGAGNAYLTKYVNEWRVAAQCHDRSSATAAICEFTPDAPGTYRIIATIADTRGRAQSTTIETWVVGKGEVFWTQPDDAALRLDPEQQRYAVGDTARYLVRNPYPGAKALISIERYGVIKSWVQTLETSTPVIEFPIEPSFVPGVYLSVLAASPRVERPPGDNDVDLGKPAVRLGYTAIPIDDPYKQIDVTINTDRDVYEPRQRVHVALQAKPRHAAGGEELEIGVAVLDEAVLDLIQEGKDHFDPYRGFYALDALDVGNFNLLTRLVGKQKFEKKGANAGGGGGAQELGLRTLFEYVSYWNPAIRTDRAGRARFGFDVPDNLTGWRILAFAVDERDRMGLGDASFKVNKATELRPVMPNQITEGDQFTAGFSVMNRTEAPRSLNVLIEARGPVPSGLARANTMLVLAPYERKTLWLPVASLGDGGIAFSARAGDAQDADGLTHRVPVRERRALETAATFGTSLSGPVTEPIVYPANMRADTGALSVVASPTVLGNIDGAFRYMRDYPYACWEQKLSKAVMAAKYQSLSSYLSPSFTWPEADELIAQALMQAAAFQAPNGGMAYWVARDAHASPYLSAYTALAFGWLRQTGQTVPEQVWSKLEAYLRTLLRKDELPEFYDRGMAATFRAVALSALASRGNIERDELERYRTHVPYMSAFGKTQFLSAAHRLGDEELVEDTLRRLLASTHTSGAKLALNEDLDDGYRHLLSTPLRANCALLDAIVALEGRAAYAGAIGDLPTRLARSIAQARGARGHWENTQENLFCVNALASYSRAYESDEPDLRLIARLDDEELGEARFAQRRDAPVSFQRAIEANDPGTTRTLTLERDGTGRFYYAARLQYAPSDDSADRTNAGIEIRREYSVMRDGRYTLLRSPMQLARGELVRVDLYVSLPSARHFVVVDDAVAGGLEPVNRDLATTSATDAQAGDFDAAGGAWWYQHGDWQSFGDGLWRFYHKELRHDSVRFFSDYLPAGNYHLSYAAQAIAAGRFSVAPVHAEEMYAPDVFGRGLPAVLEVSGD